MAHQLNDFFDRIFIISIDRNKHRLDIFLKNNPGLNVEIFKGVDGKNLYPQIKNVSQFPKSFFKNQNLDFNSCSRFNKGQLGCAMSNFLVQQEIIEKKFEKVLVLEDDAFLLTENLALFTNAILELPSNWEMFYLGFNPISKWAEHRGLRFIVKLKHLIKPVNTHGMSSASFHYRFFPKHFSKSLNIPGIYFGTHAYALSYLGAQKLVELDTPLKKGFDIMLMHSNYYKLLISYSLKKQLFIPNNNFQSSLIN